MSDGIHHPNPKPPRPDPIPDKWRARNGTYFNPNKPAPEREPVKDMRPAVLLRQVGYESAEEWGNAILARKDGHGRY